MIVDYSLRKGRSIFVPLWVYSILEGLQMPDKKFSVSKILLKNGDKILHVSIALKETLH